MAFQRPTDTPTVRCTTSPTDREFGVTVGAEVEEVSISVHIREVEGSSPPAPTFDRWTLAK